MVTMAHHRARLAVQRAGAGLHELRHRPDRHRHRHRRRPGDRQHVHRRGRAPPVAGEVHRRSSSSCRRSARCSASGSGSCSPPRRAVAEGPVVRAGRPGFESGWRWMYDGRRAAGADRDPAALRAARVAALAHRPRPAGRGRRGRRRHGARRRPPRAAPEPVDDERREADDAAQVHAVPRAARNPMYLRRVVLLVLVWLTGYVTVYGFSAGFTSVLTAQGYEPPEAGVIVAVGAFGFLLCAARRGPVLGAPGPQAVAADLRRRSRSPGCVVIAAAGDTLGDRVHRLGGHLLRLQPVGADDLRPLRRSFPTRARTTGFALVDGVGHLGGGIGVLLIAPATPPPLDPRRAHAHQRASSWSRRCSPCSASRPATGASRSLPPTRRPLGTQPLATVTPCMPKNG